jgi:hypothetical protein
MPKILLFVIVLVLPNIIYLDLFATSGPIRVEKGEPATETKQQTQGGTSLISELHSLLCLLSLASTTPIQRSKGRRYPLCSLLLSHCRQLHCFKTIFPCFQAQHQLRAVAPLPPLRCGAQGLLTEINECAMPPTSQVAARGLQRSGLIDQEQ